MDDLTLAMRPEPADDASRWAAAEALLGRCAPVVPRARLRPRWRIIWSAVGAAFVSAAVLGLVFSPGAVGQQDDVLLWREVTGVAVLATGLVVAVVGGVVAWRRGVWRAARFVQPESELTRRQRRQLYAQARGRTPVVPERVRLARHVAERLSRQRYSGVLWSGLAMTQAGRLIAAGDRLTALSAVPSVLAFLLLLVVVSRQGRQAERFLAAHPAGAQGG